MCVQCPWLILSNLRGGGSGLYLQFAQNGTATVDYTYRTLSCFVVLGTKGGAEDIGRTMDKTQSSTLSSLSELSKGRIVFYVNGFLLCAFVYALDQLSNYDNFTISNEHVIKLFRTFMREQLRGGLFRVFIQQWKPIKLVIFIAREISPTTPPTHTQWVTAEFMERILIIFIAIGSGFIAISDIFMFIFMSIVRPI